MFATASGRYLSLLRVCFRKNELVVRGAVLVIGLFRADALLLQPRLHLPVPAAPGDLADEVLLPERAAGPGLK